MKKHFVVSLVKNGILGGAIVADSCAITYRTGKLTIPAEYRNLQMKYTDISGVELGWLLILPTVTIKMKNGKSYKFVVFNRKRFIDVLKEMNVEI